MARKKTNVNIYTIIAAHPVTGEPVDLKWWRGASRYNNGGTMYGDKYKLRYLIAQAKQRSYAANQNNRYGEMAEFRKSNFIEKQEMWDFDS